MAFEQFVAPTRVLFGQISDAHPWRGRHRVPYIWLGTALFCGLAVLSIPLIFHVGQLLADGATTAFVFGAAALCGLVATVGMETPIRHPPQSAQSSPAQSSPQQQRQDAFTLRQAWTLITSSRQVLIFFSFLVLFTLALFLQDPILESYGAQVFGMSIASTATLNAIWGMGTLVGLLVAGAWVVPSLGKLATARLGCQLILASLLLLVLVGLCGRVSALQLVMALFGLSAGIATNSALVLMLDLTLPQAAGTFVGVWGLAQALSRAMGKVFGGALLDLGQGLQQAMAWGDSAYPPFALVLLVESGIAVAALFALSRVNVHQFREDTGRSLSKVLSLELG